MMRAIASLVSAKVGRCARCMRWSLRGAILGWCSVGVAQVLHVGTPIEEALLVWPACFSALWMLHITTYGARRAMATGERAESSFVAEPHVPVGGPHVHRRRVLRTFAQGAALAVIASASLPSRARADDCVSQGQPCILYGTPCCGTYTCKGTFPNTTCQ